MIEIETAIDIRAPAERVWTVLTDFAAYPQWNPFIVEISGMAEAGQRLRARLAPPGGRAMNFRPTVLAADPNRELRWLGHLFMPGLFDGEHVFRLEMRDTICRFRQEERFSGVLSSLLGRGPLNATRRGFEAMNAALKARAES